MKTTNIVLQVCPKFPTRFSSIFIKTKDINGMPEILKEIARFNFMLYHCFLLNIGPLTNISVVISNRSLLLSINYYITKSIVSFFLHASVSFVSIT